MATDDDDTWCDDMLDDGDESGDDVLDVDESDSFDDVNESNEESSSKVLTSGQVVEVLFKELREVQNIIQIPMTSVRILLNHFKWDKQKLYERYYLESCSEKIFEEAKVLSPSKIEALAARTMDASSTDCEICFLPLPDSSKAGLECGHLFCTECWKEYLETKIVQDGVSLSIQCPSGDCQVLVNDAAVLQLLQDSEHATKYELLITNNLVECNGLMRWCPAPNCHNAVHVGSGGMQEIRCTCGHRYCYACAEDWHGPVSCATLRKWAKKCADDSETVNWINANTKECPKCNNPIEKNGGCNHMTCRKLTCGYDFCWICLGPWRNHNYSGCNKYDPAKENSKESSRSWLKKYLFYYERYKAQLDSRKLEHRLYDVMSEKMEQMMQLGENRMDTKYLLKAVDTLNDCRVTLMNTYIFAYYLKKNNHSEIFEGNQRDLESSTEMLSEYMEQEIPTDNLDEVRKNLDEIKEKVTNKLRWVI